MFQADAHEPKKDLRDTDKVHSIGEGEEMQPKDDHTYRNTSEQIPISYPYEKEQSAPNYPVAGNYPPRSDQYQQPKQSAVTRPFEQLPAGSYQPVAANQYPSAATGTYQPGAAGPYQPTAANHQAQSAQTDLFGQPLQTGSGQSYTQNGSMVLPAKPQRSGLRTGAILLLSLLLATVFGTGLFAGWQFGRTSNTASSPVGTLQPSDNPSVSIPQLTGNNEDAVRQAVIQKVQPGVVQLIVNSGNAQSLGSGVIIDKRGYIITNSHVVDNAENIQVTLADGTQVVAEVTGTDPADDLAVIKITPPGSDLTTVSLGDSSQLKVGQAVLAIGSPLGNAQTVTNGIISALNRNVSEGQNQATLPDAIQTDAPINPGNSGGALVDMQGNLVGIPTLNAINTEFNTPANGLGFAIPSNRVQFIAKQIIADGKVTHTGRAILGVSVSNVTQKEVSAYQLGTTSGALIANINPSSSAEKAGLQAHDVIVQVGNKSVRTTSELSNIMLQYHPGDKVSVKAYRGGQQITADAVLDELPAAR